MEVRYRPLKRGISAILARYPMKTRQMGAIPPSAILSRKGIARYGGVSRHWAAKPGTGTRSPDFHILGAHTFWGCQSTWLVLSPEKKKPLPQVAMCACDGERSLNPKRLRFCFRSFRGKNVSTAVWLATRAFATENRGDLRLRFLALSALKIGYCFAHHLVVKKFVRFVLHNLILKWLT